MKRLFLCILFLLFASVAIQADTQDRLPDTDGAINQYSCSTGTSRFALVDDAIGAPDDDSTYIFATSTLIQNLHHPAFSITSSAITSVSVTLRGIMTTGSCNHNVRLIVNGTAYNLGNIACQNSYTNHTWTANTNPETTAAWTEADVEGTGANPLEGFQIRGASFTGGGEQRITQGYLTVTYTAAGGSRRVYIISQLRPDRSFWVQYQPLNLFRYA